jgi:hypothetical protein
LGISLVIGGRRRVITNCPDGGSISQYWKSQSIIQSLHSKGTMRYILLSSLCAAVNFSAIL